jgi:hypothetical protein
VVDLRNDRKLSFVEALHEPCFPQGAILCEGMGGDVSSDLSECFETPILDQDVPEMLLNMDLWIVNPESLSKEASSRAPPQRIDQLVALHDAFLEQLIHVLLGDAGAVQDESGEDMKRL